MSQIVTSRVSRSLDEVKRLMTVPCCLRDCTVICEGRLLPGGFEHAEDREALKQRFNVSLKNGILNALEKTTVAFERQ